jgi:hypothetical protein
MSEEYDDVPEQEETNLSGEYVWNGSYLTGADIDVNDTGHEGYFKQQIIGSLYDEVISIAKNIKQHLEKLPEDQLTDDQSEFLEYYDGNIKAIGDSDNGYALDEFLSFLETLGTIDSHSYEEFGKSNKETLDGLSNPRKWGCKQGNIINRGHNFDLWGWNDEQAKNLLDMIYEIAQEDVVSPTTSLSIHDYETGRNYSTTVGELEAKEKAQNVVPGAVKTQSNVHIPWDKSKLIGDNNNFIKFKNWIKLRENKS